MSRIVPLPVLNTAVDNTVAVLNPDGSVASFTAGALATAATSVAQTVTASAAALAAQATTTGVNIRASKTNGGTTFVGGSDVSAANGYPLDAGESVSVAVSNASALFIIGTVADTVRVLRS